MSKNNLEGEGKRGLLSGIKKFSVEVEGIKLVGELYRPDAAGAKNVPAVVLCHGIPSGQPVEGTDPGYRPLAEKLAQKGFMAVLFNFRGSGESGGNIDIAGWCRDLSAVLDMLFESQKFDHERLALWGFSGGGAVSCCVAARDKRVAAAVLAAAPAGFEALFPREALDDIIKKARRLGIIRDINFPPDPQRWLEDTYRVKAVEAIAGIAPRPVFIMHGTADDVVPVEDAIKLYEAAGERTKLVLLEGMGHRLRMEPEALETAVDWLCDTFRVREGRDW